MPHRLIRGGGGGDIFGWQRKGAGCREVIRARIDSREPLEHRVRLIQLVCAAECEEENAGAGWLWRVWLICEMPLMEGEGEVDAAHAQEGAHDERQNVARSHRCIAPSSLFVQCERLLRLHFACKVRCKARGGLEITEPF